MSADTFICLILRLKSSLFITVLLIVHTIVTSVHNIVKLPDFILSICLIISLYMNTCCFSM